MTVEIQYRPQPGDEWRHFASGQFDSDSLHIANVACGYEKYRLVDTHGPSTFGEIEED